MKILEEVHIVDANNQVLLDSELLKEFGVSSGDTVCVAFIVEDAHKVKSNEFVVTKDGFRNVESQNYIAIPDSLLAESDISTDSSVNIACAKHAIIIYQPDETSVSELQAILESLELANRIAQEEDTGDDFKY